MIFILEDGYNKRPDAVLEKGEFLRPVKMMPVNQNDGDCMEDHCRQRDRHVRTLNFLNYFLDKIFWKQNDEF